MRGLRNSIVVNGRIVIILASRAIIFNEVMHRVVLVLLVALIEFSSDMDLNKEGFMVVPNKEEPVILGIQLVWSMNENPKGDACGVSSSMGNQEKDQAVGHATVSKHTSPTWNEDFESDDEVDEVIFPEVNKLG
ncbi:hypothetical protein Tco_0332537 [Tanacetum coccineum]